MGHRGAPQVVKKGMRVVEPSLLSPSEVALVPSCLLVRPQTDSQTSSPEVSPLSRGFHHPRYRLIGSPIPPRPSLGPRGLP